MGKPPISDAAMRRMYETMKTLREARQSTAFWKGISRDAKSAAQAEPESLLAGIFSQLHRRDTVLTAGETPLLKVAVQSYFPGAVTSLHVETCDGTDEECAAVAAGYALRSLETLRDPRPVTVAILRSFPALTGTLRILQEKELPLLIVVKADAEARAVAEKRMKSTQVPILPVDAADAVAVCRVMQESMLRARNGWGGAVIHAITLPAAQDSVEAMAERVRARGLLHE